MRDNQHVVLQVSRFRVICCVASQVALVVKNSPANAGDTKRRGFDSWVGKVSWRRKWQPTPVFLPGKFHGQRGVAGYSPWGLRVRHDRAPEHTNASYYATSSSEKAMAPTPVLLPGKSHGWRSLVGCSPWGREESDTTERLHFHLSLSCIGGGNGNPLQCSCLENPRDGGAWWAAVYGVAQSRTRLKQLSSSSTPPLPALPG